MSVKNRKMPLQKTTSTPVVLPPETPVKQNLLEKLQELLEKKPENFDVIFSVGSDKTLVRGLKVILKAASPIFEKEFDEKWDNLLKELKEGEGIPLPDYDAKAFQLFIKLTMLDTWTADALRKLNLPPDQMFSLMSICRHFEMKNAIKNLEESAKAFFKSFSQYKDSNDFLKLSQANLETVLSSDQVGLKELEIFQCALRWAESQCKELKKEVTTDNLRLVLGGCLFQIRFPLMTATEFTKALGMKNILTAEETLEIYKFIGLEEKEKLTFDAVSLPFSTKRRVITVQLKKPILSTIRQSVKLNPPFQAKQNPTAGPTKLPVMKLPSLPIMSASMYSPSHNAQAPSSPYGHAPSSPFSSSQSISSDHQSSYESPQYSAPMRYSPSQSAPGQQYSPSKYAPNTRYGFNNSKHSNSNSNSNSKEPVSAATLPENCITLSLIDDLPASGDKPFICDGSEHSVNIASRRKIAVHGLGFLGPIEEDSYFDVTVEFKTYADGVEIYSSKKTKKQIFAQKGKIFHFYFNEPITLTQSQFKEWGNDHAIYYYLKGPDTESVERKIGHNSLLSAGNTQFRLGWYSNQLAEVLFKKY